MAAFAGNSYVYEQDTGLTVEPNAPGQYKEIILYLDDTASNTNTTTVTLANYGITTLYMVKGYTHTTEGQLIIEEAPTTSVTAGVLTITIGGSTPNKARAFLIGGI